MRNRYSGTSYGERSDLSDFGDYDPIPARYTSVKRLVAPQLPAPAPLPAAPPMPSVTGCLCGSSMPGVWPTTAAAAPPPPMDPLSMSYASQGSATVPPPMQNPYAPAAQTVYAPSLATYGPPPPIGCYGYPPGQPVGYPMPAVVTPAASAPITVVQQPAAVPSTTTMAASAPRVAAQEPMQTAVVAPVATTASQGSGALEPFGGVRSQPAAEMAPAQLAFLHRHVISERPISREDLLATGNLIEAGAKPSLRAAEYRSAHPVLTGGMPQPRDSSLPSFPAGADRVAFDFLDRDRDGIVTREEFEQASGARPVAIF